LFPTNILALCSQTYRLPKIEEAVPKMMRRRG